MIRARFAREASDALNRHLHGMRRPVSDLRGRHRGRPALVIGGGSSKDTARHRWPDDPVVISTNHHGLALATCAYVVAFDFEPHGLKRADFAGVPVITSNHHPPHWGTYEFEPFDLALTGSNFVLSGLYATWLASDVLKCRPVYVTGCDLYSGTLLDLQLAQWASLVRLSGNEIIPLGGGLEQHWKLIEYLSQYSEEHHRRQAAAHILSPGARGREPPG